MSNIEDIINNEDWSENFDDIEWQFFNTDGSPDSSVPLSKTRYDFKEYSFLYFYFL